MAVQTNSNNLGKAQGAKRFFKSVRSELKKVIWPNKEELTSYTSIVLVTCAIAAVGIWLVDTIFGKILMVIIK